ARADCAGARAAGRHAARPARAREGRRGVRDGADRRPESLQGASRAWSRRGAGGRRGSRAHRPRQAPPHRRVAGWRAPGAGAGQSGAGKVAPPMRFASARMYMWAPSLSAAWRRLLSTIVARAGVDVTVMEEADPTPLDALWQRADMGC